MIPEVEGTRPWGPRGKGSLSVSKGPKPPIQLLQLLKNSPRERKRAYFRYILGPPVSHPGDGITGAHARLNTNHFIGAPDAQRGPNGSEGPLMLRGALDTQRGP